MFALKRPWRTLPTKLGPHYRRHLGPSGRQRYRASSVAEGPWRLGLKRGCKTMCQASFLPKHHKVRQVRQGWRQQPAGNETDVLTEKAVGGARGDSTHRPHTVLPAPPLPPSLPRALRLPGPSRGVATTGHAERTTIGSATLAHWLERLSSSHVRQPRGVDLRLSFWNVQGDWGIRRTGPLRTRSLQRGRRSRYEERAPTLQLPQYVFPRDWVSVSFQQDTFSGSDLKPNNYPD